MKLVFCRERDELEKRIAASLRLLSENSTKAAALAKKPTRESHLEFSALHSQDTRLRDEVKTLKDCLQLHKDCHGC
jgi:hypothetical protein